MATLNPLVLARCRWARRRLDRWLDGDRAEPLSTSERARLERHLAACTWCAELAADHRAVAGRLAAAAVPADRDRVARLTGALDRLAGQPGPPR